MDLWLFVFLVVAMLVGLVALARRYVTSSVARSVMGMVGSAILGGAAVAAFGSPAWLMDRNRVTYDTLYVQSIYELAGDICFGPSEEPDINRATVCGEVTLDAFPPVKAGDRVVVGIAYVRPPSATNELGTNRVVFLQHADADR